MELLRKIKNRILTELNRYVRPQMFRGFKNKDGKTLHNTRISNTTTINKENITIGDHVFIGHYNFIDGSHNLTIEEGCQITNYVSILNHSSHISIRLYGKEYIKRENLKGYNTGKVYIGKYTFIGPHSVIMPGTIIGKGSIVSAFSFVKGDFPDFSIIAGNPAKVVGDTRSLDTAYLEQYPELKKLYNSWASD